MTRGRMPWLPGILYGKPRLSGLKRLESECSDFTSDSSRPRTNPDGDVELPGADYANFHVPECSKCIEQGETHSIVSLINLLSNVRSNPTSSSSARHYLQKSRLSRKLLLNVRAHPDSK